MLSKRERDRTNWLIVLIYGLWNTCDQWSKILIPFAQWSIEPRPDYFWLLMLNSIGNAAIVIGSFLVAQLIDSKGCRLTAMICTVVIGIYQIGIIRIKDFYGFGGFNLLLAFHHMPLIVDACIAQMVGEDGDDKERSRLMMRLTIPLSIAFAAGPYLAIQILYIVSPSIEVSETICGCVLLATVLPLCYYVMPTTNSEKTLSRLPSFESYMEILSEPKALRSLLFLALISGPYNAYDQIVRIHLATRMLSNPGDMSKLAFVLGATALVANIFILPFLQRRFGPQQLVMIACTFLLVSYGYLSQVSEYFHLIIGMPLQVLGACIAIGQLSAQVMSSVPRSHVGKAAALIRIVQVTAIIMTPLVTGYYIDISETQKLCTVSAVVTLFTIPLVWRYGGFMKNNFANLPMMMSMERTHSD
uniref:MFS domain-containing protein n=1 Tax=Steinernema glaseri TaxID=37863 RepID=A0A1I7ZIH7_9BILA